MTQIAIGATRMLRIIRSFIFTKRASAAVEFSLVAAPFVAVLLALFEVALVFIASEVLEVGVDQTSRAIMTGQAQKSNMTASQFATALCAKVNVFFSCGGLMVNVQAYDSFSTASATPPTLTFNSKGQVTNGWQFQPGTQGQIVVVQVMYQWPVILGPLGFTLANLANGNRLLVATAAFKNEPYQ